MQAATSAGLLRSTQTVGEKAAEPLSIAIFVDDQALDRMYGLR
jgi:hypothetical protein